MGGCAPHPIRIDHLKLNKAGRKGGETDGKGSYD